MAKKRKHHKKHRRVGALNLGGKKTQSVVKILSIAGGYLMGDTINGWVDKILPTQTTTTATATGQVSTVGPNQMIGIVGELGIGGLLLLKKMAAGTTGTMLTAAGGILAGAGLKRALKKAGVISGYHAVPVIGTGGMGRKRVTGFQSVPVIGKTPPQLSGKMPAQLQGYKVGGGYVPAGSGSSMGYCDDGGSGLVGASTYMH